MDSDKFYDKAWLWILTYGPKIVIAIIIFIVGQWLIRLLKSKLRNRMKEKKVNSSLRSFLQSLVIAALHIFLVLMIMQIVGIQLTIFAAVIAAFGAAAGFALSGTLQNFTSGILIIILKPFNVGDNIFAQNQEGTVTTIQLFYTVITTFDNRTVILPNSKLFNEVIVNITRQGRRRLDIELKFNYGIDFELIKSTIINSIMSYENVLHDPEPRVGMLSLEPDGYKCMVNIWINAHGYVDTRLIINEKIFYAMKENGIKLPGL